VGPARLRSRLGFPPADPVTYPRKPDQLRPAFEYRLTPTAKVGRDLSACGTDSDRI